MTLAVILLVKEYLCVASHHDRLMNVSCLALRLYQFNDYQYKQIISILTEPNVKFWSDKEAIMSQYTQAHNVLHIKEKFGVY